MRGGIARRHCVEVRQDVRKAGGPNRAYVNGRGSEYCRECTRLTCTKCTGATNPRLEDDVSVVNVPPVPI